MLTTRKRRELILDVLPEQYPYRDDGCEVSPRCLDCPLPQCKYDDPAWYYQELRRHRDEAIIHVRQAQRLSVPQLARRFGLSQRTIHRIIRRTVMDDPEGGFENGPASGVGCPPRHVGGVDGKTAFADKDVSRAK